MNTPKQNDITTTVQDLKNELAVFRDERDWKQFHDLKNLGEAIAVEASELQELFLWKTIAQIQEQFSNDEDFRTKVRYELADIINMCLAMANVADIDITQTILEKNEINRQKYPIEKSRGKSTKYTEL